MTDAYIADIEGIEGLEMVARPDFSIINFTSQHHDMSAVASGLSARGWLPTLTRRPVGLHMMMSLFHEEARPAYIADLRAAIAEGAGAKPLDARLTSYAG
jgi:hypothetical protein